MLLVPWRERPLFPCLWRQGIDEWEPYCQLYVEALWERYVRPLGAARKAQGTGRKQVKQAPSAAAAAAGAGDKGGGGARRRLSCW